MIDGSCGRFFSQHAYKFTVADKTVIKKSMKICVDLFHRLAEKVTLALTRADIPQFFLELQFFKKC